MSRKQLLDAGIGRGSIGRMLCTGYLHQVHDGVYAVGHRKPVELGAETAALLACRKGAVLSHRSIGALWGWCAPPRDGTVHVTVVGSGGRKQKGITIHRTKRLDRHDVRIHRGLPVTSPGPRCSLL